MPLPLQVGVPGGVELFIVLFLATVVAVPLVLASLIIYLDAVDRNSRHVLAWTVAALLGGVVVWALYFVVRDEVGGNGLTVKSRP
ncbi:hypothetical protein [Halorubrum halophilum]|uniref:hypothetical protein n=1 Tax=Halorubrum halophilum TaxID=413816 RepID=UPI0006797C03|nr:hypothetical protein [Halorubrum halophilum]